MLRLNLGLLLALFSFHSLALEGIYFEHHDWEIACDNTGTCRMAGYGEQDVSYTNPESERHIPVSVYFERKAGETAISGKVKFELESGQMPPVSLWLNNQPLGELQPIKDSSELEYQLTPQQTGIILPALVGAPTLEVRAPKIRWQISERGATAVMLKMDEFQKRLDTPTALVRKGLSNKPILALQPVSTIKLVNPLKQNPAWVAEQIWEENPRYTPLLSLLKSQMTEDECFSLGYEGNAVTVQQISADRKLIGSLCTMGAYNFSWLYVLTDLAEKQVFWHSSDYADFTEGKLYGSYKMRGLGDCWLSREAVWNGERFIKSEEFSTGQCRDFAGGAWTLPTLISNVTE
ncbi:MAG: DUF1176 domain-containing protein [Lonepinella koalarum]|nr:DUF1176 domain-containing protein [Lonepinella koalarum]